MATPSITAKLRKHQESDERMGLFFKALHAFADRTIAEFFHDTPGIPHPVVALEPDRKNRRGFYTPMDGYALVHRINLNPMALRNGEEAAETLAHEIVHLWQYHIGRPIKKDFHTKDFHDRMLLYGIETTGKHGTHARYTDGTWQAWMEQNKDLELDKFTLPGPKPKGRQLIKHQCPDCGASFQCRRVLNVLCLECSVPFEVV